MSKVGKVPVKIPSGVSVTVKDNIIQVKGPKGELSQSLPTDIQLENKDDVITVRVSTVDSSNLRWLARVLIHNMIVGVTQWFERKLLVLGVWFSAKIEGTTLVLNLWFSHPVKYTASKGIQVQVEKDPKGNSVIILQGIDKQLIGQTAAQIREIKKPEPYKGKGIRYLGEVVKMKAGKTSKK